MLWLALFILGEPYTLTISMFERALALHNLIAFVSFYTQWRGLIGSKGISPAKELMQRVKERGWTWQRRWRDLPTLAWYSCSDTALDRIQLVGIAASLCAFLGVFSGCSIFVCAVCYSSIKAIGGVFTGLQMHAHLMEINLMYTACAPFQHVSPAAWVVLASLLNFRVMLGGGSGKWYAGDKSWHDGTAMQFHYWTQPIPNPISPYFHRLPVWVHRMETYATFLNESFAALFVFAPWPLRLIPFVMFESLMLAINLTGNYAQIGAHTMNESILLLNDDLWNWVFDLGSFVPGVDLLRRWLYVAHGPHWFDLAFRPSGSKGLVWNDVALGVMPWLFLVIPYALIQLIPLTATFHHHNPLSLFDPYTPKPMEWYRRWESCALYTKRVRPVWHQVWSLMESAFVVARDFELFGSYVKFSHMTKYRNEIIIEGSQDGVTWREYEFKFKPSRVTKRPPFIPFHLPAMDWRLWFLPLEAGRGGEPPVWFMRILARLLECEPTVMALFDYCPFDASSPPIYMRALLYDYRFRFQYEKENELKQLCRDFSIRDTTIVEQSDAEEEEEEEEDEDVIGQFDDILRKEEEEEEEEEEGEVAQPAQEDTTGLAKMAKEGEGEHEIAEPEQKAQEHVDEKEAASGKKPSSAAGSFRGARSDSSGGALRSRATRSSVDERARKAQAVRERKLLQALLRGRVPPAKPLKKLAHEAPPEFDEQGRRLWWVRRHLIGPYGPVLTVRPRPPPVAADAPAWEQALEPDED